MTAAMASITLACSPIADSRLIVVPACLLRAPAIVDALQQTQRAEADGALRERMAEVFDDVERDGHVQAGKHARRALGVDARHDRVELAVHEVDARADARAARRQPRIARREC